MISNKKVILPSDMDNECIELCEKLNSLSHIETCESCCGHLKNRYMIFFWCDDFVRLAKLYRCVNRNYSDGKWEIIVDGSDVHPTYRFLLRSIEPFKTTEEIMESVHYLMENINIWENPKFNEYFESNKCYELYEYEYEQEDHTHSVTSANWKASSKYYSSPTLEVAQRWLREIKRIFIHVSVYPVIEQRYEITDSDKFSVWAETWDSQSEFGNKWTSIFEINDFNTYEQAQEAGIKKALEMILEK